MRTSSTRSGFTLVELLVVIGIIGLLISILLPAMNRARESGRRVSCASNMREIGVFMNMYFNDHKNRLPRINQTPWIAPLPGDPQETIVECLRPYTKNATGFWRCSSDRLMVANGDTGALAGMPAAEHYYDVFEASYQYNVRLNVQFGGDNFIPSINKMGPFGRAVTADKIWIFHEYAPFHGRAGKPGSCNYLFADWHVGDIQ
ncbi:MAG TPA: prepilin-type N-terminal cleavage/methylation domain-containing protein [Tepidisphaeraceae bacterium]|jgi:prepilin-type N-terminal cleavage/methylation domain-containing protein/prepilin-type processing-associated H-X9-DG protein